MFLKRWVFWGISVSHTHVVESCFMLLLANAVQLDHSEILHFGKELSIAIKGKVDSNEQFMLFSWFLLNWVAVSET